jgi:hypothetical protein
MLYGNADFKWQGEGETQQLALTLPPRSGCIFG